MSDYDVDDGDYLEGSDEDAFESPDTADDDDLPVVREKGKQKELEYESLSPEQLFKSMDVEVQRFVNLSGLDPTIASILCRHYRWNTDLLLEKFMDSPKVVLKAIGEPPTTSSPDGMPPSKRPRTRSSKEFVCGVCFTTPEENGTFKARCSHEFCGDCYQIYVRGKVKNEGQSKVHCMEESCKVILTDQDVKTLCDESTYSRYREILLEAFVKSCPHLRFCPYPSCKQTISCRDVSSSSLSTSVPIVHCSVEKKHVFCFGCGVDDDHRPAICKTVSLWLSNARDDAGTSEWLKANTRACPKCHQSIEKNGGCNRIYCRHCNHQFCWVCNAAWDKHGYQNKSCNAFVEPTQSDPEARAKANLDRWLFYFDRWNNHEISAKLDERLYETLEDRIKEVQDASEGGMSWIEARFMKNAVEELTRCRWTLKWTYAMAFYLKGGNAKMIFEDLQANLEKAVEELSQMLEEEIQQSTIKNLRMRMVDKTVYVRTRQNILLEDAARGLQEGRWEWTVPID